MIFTNLSHIYLTQKNITPLSLTVMVYQNPTHKLSKISLWVFLFTKFTLYLYK